MKTILLLKAGPYFWPHLDVVRAQFQSLSEYYNGFVLSFVSRKEFCRVKMNNFELYGHYIKDSTYRFFLLKMLIRFFFTIGRGCYLHFFRKRLSVIIAYDPLVTGVLAFILSRLTGVKYIVEVNGSYGNEENWKTGQFSMVLFLKYHYAKIVIPFILNRADGVKVLYKDQLQPFRGLERLKQFQFHDFVAIDGFRPSRRDVKIILFIGHPWKIKGIDILIKAFNKVNHDFPDYILRIVGYLPEKDLYKPLFEGNNQIEFYGSVFGDKIIELFQESSLFVLPSRSEAMGRVLLEAMASRVPIIASRVGGIPTYIKHGFNGLLFESENVDDLAEKMKEVMANRAYSETLAENGYEYVRKHLSPQSYLDHFRKMLDRVQP